MKRRFSLACSLLAMILALALVWGCSDDDSNPTDPGGGTDVGTISGIVSEPDGSPVFGAVATTGARTTTSNEQGYFVLTDVPVGETLLGISAADHMSTFRVLAVSADGATHYADIVLVAVETATLDGAAGGTVSTGDGDGTIDFAANSFVDAAGNPYAGQVTVQLNALLPTDDEFYGAFPGEFAGIDEGGNEVPFVSFGFMTVKLMSGTMAPLQLADGVTATMNLTIDETKAALAPATIPMWYFDEAGRVWRQEGAATLEDNVYTADVAHFTSWNWDLPVADICSITGSVVDENGAPVRAARVVSRGVDLAIMDEVYTNNAGVFTVRAVRNAMTDLWALKGSLASEPVRVSVLAVCPYVLEAPLVLTVPAYTISLNWGEAPEDLDSHLLVPMTWDTGYTYYHLYYSNMGTYGDDPYAVLDTDDTSSFGPEIITGTHLYEGRFQYWVNNYSDDTSDGIATSGAVVQLDIGGRLRTYAASAVTLEGADQTGWWHVFDLVVTGGSVTVQPVMAYQPEFDDSGFYEDKTQPAKRK